MDQPDKTSTLAARGYDALCRAVAERRRLVCGVDVDEVAFCDLRKKGYIDADGRPPVEVTAAVKVKLHRAQKRQK